jgi:hypothetical protein
MYVVSSHLLATSHWPILEDKRVSKAICIYIKGPFGKAPAPASLAPDPDPREDLILLILLENQNHF